MTNDEKRICVRILGKNFLDQVVGRTESNRRLQECSQRQEKYNMIRAKMSFYRMLAGWYLKDDTKS